LSTEELKENPGSRSATGKAVLQGIFMIKTEIVRIVTCKGRPALVTPSAWHPKPLDVPWSAASSLFTTTLWVCFSL